VIGNAAGQHARVSIVVFGAYLVGLGGALLVAPNVLLGVFGIPETSEVWIRLVGTLLAVIGFYQIQAGRYGATWFIRASVLARVGVAVSLLMFVLTGLAPAVMLLFASVDLAGRSGQLQP
jgi:hypothetical protein